MIYGALRGLQASIALPLKIPGHPDLSLEFVIDTGFAGYLTLPSAAVATLGLPYLFTSGANLADDSTVLMAVHQATIMWDGVERTVRVLATGRRPLLEMALLLGSKMSAEFIEKGRITLETI